MPVVKTTATIAPKLLRAIPRSVIAITPWGWEYWHSTPGPPVFGSLYPVPMRIRGMTRTQFLAVPCPICGVGVGERCLLYSGSLRREQHVNRKLSAWEEIETKKIARPARREFR